MPPPLVRKHALRLVLLAGDTTAFTIAIVTLMWLSGFAAYRSAATVIASGVTALALGLWSLHHQQLWLQRSNAVRTIEMSRLTKAVATFSLAALLLERMTNLDVRMLWIAWLGVASWLLLAGWRSVHRSWLSQQRRRGRFVVRLVLVGANERAAALESLLRTHPETGFRIVGLIGDRDEADEHGLGHLWRGEYGDVADVRRAVRAAGLFVCSPDVSPALLHELISYQTSWQPEIFVDPGLPGIDVRRMKAMSVAHEPFLYVEGPSLSRIDRGVKRGLDVAGATAALLLAAPVMAVVALAIKLSDRGPVLFRQARVGRGDEEFQVLKFRTMAVDAEARLAELTDGNERNGPLFKLGRDPRVTRVGHWLRSSSLDELPQLINVLRGEMSLVGPRPALPSEVAEFPPELQARHQVRPGVSGLWQVEARDNPSFDAYRRLDLFYVENWSITLDLVILIGTIDHVLLRPLMGRGNHEDGVLA